MTRPGTKVYNIDDEEITHIYITAKGCASEREIIILRHGSFRKRVERVVYYTRYVYNQL